MNGSKPRSLKTTLFVFIFTTLVFLPNFVPLSNALITPPTGIILFIGDGMGYNHIELARLAEYGPEGESAILEMCYETSISTSNIDNEITDSAAAATAICTGIRTRNEIISMNSYATQNLETILEIAQSNGYSTGIVATSHLTHATPAAFMAHNSDRNNYRDIAEDISTADVDVLLGAGSGYSYLGRDISAMESKGYTYITNKTSLNATTSLPVLGLFTSSSLTPAYQRLESSPEPSLLEMTQKAIELLNNSGNPFFLMIEGSQIDWGAHENSRAYTGFETIEFEKSVKFAKELAENDPNLLLLVTADHETGGLSLGDYEFLTALPEESDDYTTRKSKRLARLNEISIYWSTSGHTNSEVILAGMGPNAEKILDAEHHTDTFSIMRKVIDGKTRPSLVNPQGLIYVGIFIGILSISAALTVIFIKLQQRKITV